MPSKPEANNSAQLADEAENRAKLTLLPSVNAALVIESYNGNAAGKVVDFITMVDQLSETFAEVKEGDVSRLEAMLIGQATALQSMFVSLAQRAHHQHSEKQFSSLLSLALKAQAQSRATIQAIADLKYPRQVAFVNQANISHGPQQVNNGPGPDVIPSPRAKKSQFPQNELLVEPSHGCTNLDTGAASSPKRSHSELDTVGAINRSEKRCR